jgi:hypothetical protein
MLFLILFLGIRVVPELEISQFNSLNYVMSDKRVGTISSFNLNVILNSPIPINGKLRITFSSVELFYTNDTCTYRF